MSRSKLKTAFYHNFHFFRFFYRLFSRQIFLSYFRSPQYRRGIETVWTDFLGPNNVLVMLIKDVRLRLGLAGDRLLKRTARL